MIDVLFQTLPFFAIIALGFGAGKTGFFPPEATAWLTKFVFFFPLSALLARFSARFPLSEIWDWVFIAAYLIGTLLLYALVVGVAFARKRPLAEAAFEALGAVSGNLGFLGLPLLALLLGEAAIGPTMLVIAVDLFFFSSLTIILVTAAREGRVEAKVFGQIGLGLIKNPLIVSLMAGFLWSATGAPLPETLDTILVTLGAAATPGALFAIGATLATKSAERIAVAGWLSFAKLILHPLIIAFCALSVFGVAPYPAAVMIAAAAMPVASNIYMQAMHYGIAPLRISAAILVSTTLSVVTFTAAIVWVKTLM